MKRVVFFGGVLGFLMVGFIFPNEVQAGEPKVLIPEVMWDFGLIPVSSVVSHHYLVRNVGTDTLKIEGVKPG